MESNQIESDQVPLRAEVQTDFSKEVFTFLLWVRRATLLALPIAIYQIVSSAINLSDWNSSLNKLEVVESSFSLILILVLIKRVISTFSSNNHHENLLETGAKEQILYLVSTILLAVVKVIVTLNAYIQSGYVQEYLTALSSDNDAWNTKFGDKSVDDVSSLLLNLRIAFIVFNIYLAVYFVLVARGIFYHISDKKQAVSALINAANLITISFALVAICQIYRVEQYQAYPYLNQLNPKSSLNKLYFGLLLLVIVCFASWVTNYRRWKAGYFIFSVIFLVLGVYLSTTAGFTFRGARATKNYYLTNWEERMDMVDESELLSIGCPSKYTPYQDCSEADQYNRWESTKTIACLNSACAGLLSQLYSNEYLTLSNEALIALAFLTVVAGGFYYFWYIAPREAYTPSKTDLIWLFVSILAAVVVILTFRLSNYETIKEFTDKQGHF